MPKEHRDLFALFVHSLARALAPLIATEMRGVSNWIDQADTPLGRNTHCAAVRRRIAEARAEGREPDAVVTPKGLYKMSPDALRDELARLGPGLAKTAPAPANETEPNEPSSDPEIDAFDAELDAALRRLR